MSLTGNLSALAATLLLLACSLLTGHISSLKAARQASPSSSSSQAGQTQPESLWLRRLRPSDFPTLPARIVKELDRRGCTIPQVTVEGLDTNKPHNVVEGEFARKGQKDWAVLCSRGGRSAIRIFWGGSGKCPRTIGSEPDNAERYLGTANAKYITEHYEHYGGTKPPPRLLHQGLNDGFAEKASQVWYCYRGKWRVLQGAD